MLKTGHQDFALFEGRNFSIEKVPTLPSFLTAYYGRFIFVTTPGSDYGLYFGGVAGWNKICQPLNQLVQEIDYLYYLFPTTDVTGLVAYERSGIMDEVAVPSQGDLILMSVTIDPPLTAGQLLCRPVVNGTEVVIGDLDVLITPASSHGRSFSDSGLIPLHVPTDGKVGVKIYGNVGSAPGLTSIRITIHVKIPLVLGPTDSYENFDFTHWQMGAAFSGPVFPMYGFSGFRASRNGHILTTAAQLTLPLTGVGGVLDLLPTINGVPVGTTALDLKLDSVNPMYQYKSVAVQDANLAFSAGDLIGLRAASNSFFAPINDLLAHMSVWYS